VAVAFVQSKVGLANNATAVVSATFDAAPIEGDLLIAAVTVRESTGGAPASTGWTVATFVSSNSGGNDGHTWLLYRIAGVSESAVVTMTGSTNYKRLTIAEFSGVVGLGAFDANSSNPSATSYPSGPVDLVDGGLLIGAVHVSDATVTFTDDAAFTTIATGLCFGSFGPKDLVSYRIAAAGSYSWTPTSGTSDGWAGLLVAFEGEPDVIPEPPPYVPPIPGGALIEIRAASPGSSRWGIALWGVGTWSAAGWQDVTPQSVDAVVRWGSHQPGAGVLAETEAGSWIVDTFDPERLLDPGNADGPYHADLRAGLPIRIRHRGTIIRQGVAESILFQHADTVGGIRVTDAVSILARTPVPEDSVLSDTLRARARDAIAAAGLRVTVEPDPPGGDPALAPRLENERSVWRHIADAAQQVLHMPFVDRTGTLRFRPWATPYDRGRGVDDTQLVDLGTLVTTAGLYSVVRAQQTVGDGGLVIERRSTPVPRYGPVTYERSDATPDAGAWADAVLADRSLQTVQWIPGAIFPLTADDVEYFATLEAMERFGVDDDAATPPVDVTGVIVGGEIRITAKRDSAAVWAFELELSQTADSPLYFDATDPPEFMLNETGDGYLYGD
jgi:hypothetical protein